jgi:hypothetical protein
MQIKVTYHFYKVTTKIIIDLKEEIKRKQRVGFKYFLGLEYLRIFRPI